MKLKKILRAVALFSATACAFFSDPSELSAQSIGVEIETSMGVLKGFLYDDVPRHAKTFAANAEKGLYDGTLFTRVLPHFIVQGGSADSRNAPAGARVGAGDRSREIMPESNKGHFYKCGVLAAPRQLPEINPQNKSDMSQFFFFTGTVYTEGALDTLEMVVNNPIKKKAQQEIYLPLKDSLMKLRETDKVAYNELARWINRSVDSALMASPKKLIFTPEQREAYTTIGGLPTYEGEYTVYGEITEGLDVLRKIEKMPRDRFDRPKKDVRIIKIRVTH